VLGKIFVPKKQEVIEEWREMHNEDLHNLSLSSNIIWVIKSKRMSGVETCRKVTTWET
jgi:hypothetical protein